MVMGGIGKYEFGTMGYTLLWFVESACIVGVNEFVLITGYYGTGAKFKVSKLVVFYLEVVYFSVLCTAIVSLVTDGSVNVTDWIYAFFPLTSKRYWYASVYALLIFVRPLLNIIIENMDRKTHVLCIIMSLIIFSFIPTFFIWNREITGTGMDLVWFTVLYFVGAYIYKFGQRIKRKKWMLLYYAFVILLTISNIAIPFVTKKLIGNPVGIGIFNYYNTIFVFFASLGLFKAFVCNSDKRDLSKGTAILAKTVRYAFGAYLISDHRVIREVLWEKIRVPEVSNNVFIVLLYMIIVNAIILIVGISVDYVGKKLLSTKVIKKLKMTLMFNLKKSGAKYNNDRECWRNFRCKWDCYPCIEWQIMDHFGKRIV